MLELAGEIDLATVDVLEQTALRCLSDGARALTIDFDGVTFLDSAGLNSLVIMYRAAEAAGASLHARRVPERVARLLTLTSLDTLFTADPETAPGDDPPAHTD